MMIMVIVVVERIKRSRREEADGGQLKWVVDKSRQLEEGKPYSSDKLKMVARLMLAGHEVIGGGGKGRVWTGLRSDTAHSPDPT